MSKALELFKNGRGQLPSHIADFLNEESNIAERSTVPSLSYEGKVWTVSYNGQKTKMMKRDENGDEMPMPVMRVVILDYNRNRGRSFYEGAYDPAKPGMPSCWSEDGIKPHAQATAPQSSRCDTCPMSVKGSRVTEQGKGIAACSQYRMIVVVPANNLNAPPLRMKLAMTSDYDAQSPELQADNWFAFKNYTDYLRSYQVNHTAVIVTKMKFDPNKAFPKVVFSADRPLDAEELARVRELTKSPEVKALLGGFTPNPTDAPKMISAVAQPVAPVLAKPAAKTVNVEVDDDDEDLPFVKPKPPIKVMDDDDEDEILVAKPKKAAKVIHKEDPQPVAAAKPAATKSSSEDLDALLDDWG